MILAGWMTVALVSFFLAAVEGRRGLYWLFYLAIALATLSKGIIGFLLPGMIIGLFIALTGRWRLIREMRLVPGAILAAAVVLPWFFLVQARLPDFFRYFIFDQHVSRYIGGSAEHSKPIWFFLPVAAFGFFPWVAYLPFLGAGRRRPSGGTGTSGERFRPETVFLWLWFAVIFLFFSASKGKLMPYILPAYPPLAILVAVLFARLWDPEARQAAARGIRWGSFMVAAIYLTLAPVAYVAVNRFAEKDGRITLAEIGIWPWAVVVVFALVGAAVLVLSVLRRPAAALGCLAVAQVLFYGNLIGAANGADPYLGPRSLGRALAEAAGPEDLVVLYELQQPSMEFYLNRPPMLVNWTGEYKYGMSIQPDPDLFTPDPGDIRQIMDSDRQVFVVVKGDEPSMPEAFGVPVELVAKNRKRTIYRNLP
jgi:4-amino-4-deoxy-L-arabinose transferase-like glycosyltransferase